MFPCKECNSPADYILDTFWNCTNSNCKHYSEGVNNSSRGRVVYGSWHSVEEFLLCIKKFKDSFVLSLTKHSPYRWNYVVVFHVRDFKTNGLYNNNDCLGIIDCYNSNYLDSNPEDYWLDQLDEEDYYMKFIDGEWREV